jgi:PEP-CTERM motif
MSLAMRPNSGSVTIRLLIVAALAFLVPVAAHADGCLFSNTPSCLAIYNTDGSAGGNASGLTLNGSEVYGIKGIGMPSGDKAKLGFKTGALTSGSLMNGGTFAGGLASSLTITGTYGNITNGVIFNGMFSGPVSWVLTSPSSCSICDYTLTGDISGTWNVRGSNFTTGSIVQIDFTSHGLYTGSAGNKLSDTGGVTQLFGLPGSAVVPEPGSLSLLGTGLLGLGFAVRRKVKGNRVQSL